MSVSDLSRRLAAWENDREEGMVSTQERKRVYTALRQTHLPKLQSLGVIEYDADRGTVRPTPATAELRPYLRVPSPRPWPRYYGTLALLSSALVGALVLGWLPTWLTGEWVAAAVSLCLAILALLHSRETRPGHRDRQAAAADSRRGPGAGGESPPDAD